MDVVHSPPYSASSRTSRWRNCPIRTEDTTILQRYPLTREDQPVGRLHIAANAAFKLPGLEPIYVMQMTARAMPDLTEEDSVTAFMDYGHNLIVRTFRDITTDEMHDEWGLQ